MYRILAKFYDDLQDNDYNAFVSYYQSVFKRFGLEPKLILDMGCGTGNITGPMAEKGYDTVSYTHLFCAIKGRSLSFPAENQILQRTEWSLWLL